MAFTFDSKQLLFLLLKNGVKIDFTSVRSYEDLNTALYAGRSEFIKSNEPAPLKLTEAQYASYFGEAALTSCKIIQAMNNAGLILNHPTFWVYDQYVYLCSTQNIKPEYNKLFFTKIINRTYNYHVEDVKKKNEKFRVFRK